MSWSCAFCRVQCHVASAAHAPVPSHLAPIRCTAQQRPCLSAERAHQRVGHVGNRLVEAENLGRRRVSSARRTQLECSGGALRRPCPGVTRVAIPPLSTACFPPRNPSPLLPSLSVTPTPHASTAGTSHKQRAHDILLRRVPDISSHHSPQVMNQRHGPLSCSPRTRAVIAHTTAGARSRDRLRPPEPVQYNSSPVTHPGSTRPTKHIKNPRDH